VEMWAMKVKYILPKPCKAMKYNMNSCTWTALILAFLIT
jgi:hypothetical protein